MLFDTRPKVQVCVEQTGEHYACAMGESLLQGMLRLGRKGIPVGCVNGGCGVCKVRVVEGSVRALGPISGAHVSAAEQAEGYTLACRATPVGDVRLAVAARLQKPFARPLVSSAAAVASAATFHPTPSTSKET
jgi:3-phenylpropionate/trans-cinnamate dioxygenase ferredoxin reductase subunit